MSFLLALQRAVVGFWRLLDATRRALLNLLLLALLVGLLALALRPGPPALKDKTALVLALSGPLVEQHGDSTRGRLLGQVRGQGDRGLQLRDLLAVLDAATADPKITHAVLMLEDFAGAGLPSLREFTAALERFKAAGKPVFAWAPAYSQRQYFVAAHATEVWLDPMGSVQISGLGGRRNYYRDLLDRVGISANVVRAGQYKNAGEIFSANAPSPETLRSDAGLYDALWRTWTDGVERARKLPAGSVQRGLDALPGSLLAAGGDRAKLAQASGWVDAVKTGEQLRQALIERGRASADGKSYEQVSFDAYLARIDPRRGGDAVGVVVVQGLITDGEATVKLVRQARENPRIKALVVRVNSPGGSAYGSELIRRELEITRAAGKPVVVSMGDVAASGGYWIAMAADEVIADSATITGSIGVFTLLPTVDQALDKLGVHTGGVTTTWLAGAADPRRPLDARYAALAQSRVDHIYADFIGRAAQARKSTPAQIDTVAQGRVWTGAQALERGLVDRVGHYTDALASAARRAQLAPDHRIVYLERSVGRLERLLDWFGGASLTAWVATLERPWTSGLPPVLATVHTDLDWLAAQARSGQPYPPALIHCLCGSTGL